MVLLPSGTVTFLLTDIEGSTALWERAPEAMRAALVRHDALFEQVIQAHDGLHVGARGEGDSRFSIFLSAAGAVAAALEIQRAFAREPWPTPRPVAVRIGIHTGETQVRDGTYYGTAVNRCARIRGIGHGGQTLLSAATEALVRDVLPSGAMVADLGVHRLRGLSQPERIFQLGAPDLPATFPPLVSPELRAHTFPTGRGALIGREREIAEIRALLLRPDVGLVTLIGPGGTGKTRLAAQVAAEFLDTPSIHTGQPFVDGVTFVELAPIRDPEIVAPTIGQALGVAMDGGRPPLETLKEHLRHRDMLLVLDNLEQVVEVGPSFAELLSASERLKLLVTSRVALRVSSEREYAVPSLTLPPRGAQLEREEVDALGQYGAVRLFVERAQAVRADFALTPTNARDIVAVCHRLDGLPLAIELAAARARLLPPAAMAARLAGPAGVSSLNLLTGGPRDQPERLQAIRSTIAWSYDLLDSDEQSLFRRLAIFVGGCTLEAIEAVGDGAPGAGEHGVLPGTDRAGPGILDLVDSLLGKSLLRRVEGEDAEPRYTMLETIREYGLESLALAGELAGLQRWHAEYFLTLAEEAESRMRGPEQGEWLDRLEADRDNWRAALQWSLGPDGDPAQALRLCGALSWFWYNRSHLEEARRWLGHALRQTDGASTARIKALAGAGRLAHIQHDSAQARTLLNEALALARTLDEPWWAAWALHLLGRVAYFDGDAETARAFGYQSRDLAREIDDEWLEGWALHLLGLAAHIEADYATARRFYAESLVIRRRVGFREGDGTVTTLLGLIEFAEGDFQATRPRLREALEAYRGLDAGWLMGNLIAQFIALAVAVGQMERAARLWGALSAMSEAVSIRPIPLVEAILNPAVDAARQALGAVRFDAELQVGRRLSEDEVRAEALAIDVSVAAEVAVSEPVPGGDDAPGADTASLRAAGVAPMSEVGGAPAHVAADGLVQRGAVTMGAPASLPSGLSRREAEVLGLIAAGLSTREIAARLVISSHTVERHVTHIYGKIGARGRADATAYALRHGLA